MLCTDLTLPAMIVLSGMALTLGFPAENENFLPLVKIRDSQLPNKCPSCPLGRSLNIRHKNRIRRYLEPIFMKLKNIHGKYEDKKNETEKFYRPFRPLTLPNYTKPIKFGCLNNRQLKRKVLKLWKEMKKINKNLQHLIHLEKLWNPRKHKSHEGRLKLLEEFQAEIQNLLVELKPNQKFKKKKRNKSLTHRMPKKAASANLPPIKSQTKLHLEEWKLLKNVNTSSKQWIKYFKKISECL